jgi:hypothetical protein
MRTSCDIDILVKEDIVETAKDILVEKLKYKFDGKGSHDYQLFSNNNVHLELHYTLLDEDWLNEGADLILNNVWDYIVKEKDYSFGYRFNDTMLYFFHLVHLAKHVKNGGCGIKPFLDLFIFDKYVDYGYETKELLKKGSLEKLDSAARKLSKVYFAGEEYDDLSKNLSEYILEGGVYGNTENLVAMRRGDKDSVIKYALSRIFLPYDILKYRYPELEKKKWLFIPYQFRRWFDLVFKEDVKKSLNELEINKNMSEEKIDFATKMWNDLGL